MTEEITTLCNAEKPIIGQINGYDYVAIEHEADATIYIRPNGVRLIDGNIGRVLRKGELRMQAKIWSKEGAAIARANRYELAQQRAAEGVQEAVQEYLDKILDGKAPNIMRSAPVEAVKYIAKHATEVYMNSKSPKGMSDLGYYINRIAGFVREVGDKHENMDALPMPGIEEARNIINIFNFYEKEYKRPDVVDAEAR